MNKKSKFGLVAAVAVIALVFVASSATSVVQAAGSNAISTTYSYPSSSSNSSSYTNYSSGSSSGGSNAVSTTYTYPTSSSNDGGNYNTGCCTTQSSGSGSNAITTTYTYPPTYDHGCTTNCGGGGGGCTSNCGGGGCTSNCGGGGCTHDCGGCTHNCTPHPAPKCELWVSPSKVDYGDTVTISWDTTNAISAFLSGFGTVSLDGSRESGSITGTKTFTLTATASGGKTVTCSKTVTVYEHEDEDLSCKLKASDSRIERGDSVRITWDSDGADYGYISPDIGDVDENGSDTVHPRSNTTYKGTFYNNDGDKVTCSVRVTVEDDYELPNPTPYINLSAVPYTGLDLGPVGTAIYWAFLIAWCLLAAYLVAVKRIHMSVYRWYKKALFGEDVHIAPAQASFAGFSQHELSKLADMLRGAVSHDHKPAAAPVAHADAVDPFILSQIHRGKRS